MTLRADLAKFDREPAFAFVLRDRDRIALLRDGACAVVSIDRQRGEGESLEFSHVSRSDGGLALERELPACIAGVVRWDAGSKESVARFGPFELRWSIRGEGAGYLYAAGGLDQWYCRLGPGAEPAADLADRTLEFRRYEGDVVWRLEPNDGRGGAEAASTAPGSGAWTLCPAGPGGTSRFSSLKGGHVRVGDEEVLVAVTGEGIVLLRLSGQNVMGRDVRFEWELASPGREARTPRARDGGHGKLETGGSGDARFECGGIRFTWSPNAAGYGFVAGPRGAAFLGVSSAASFAEAEAAIGEVALRRWRDDCAWTLR